MYNFIKLHLASFPKPHLIPKDAAMVVVIATQQPVNPFQLVGSEREI